jgi:PAS domain S-box-containing protein
MPPPAGKPPRAETSVPSIAGLPPTVQERQDRERRMARAYWTLAQSSRALVRATSEQDLLQQLCRLLVQVGEYHMAWVGYAIDDAEHTVRCMAQAGFDDGYLDSVHISWADAPHGRGPTGTAIRTGKPVVNRNSETDPNFAPWREQAIERGFASAIALPLTLSTGTIGALVVYSAKVEAFDADEEELLGRLAEDLAFGIGALRERVKRDEAEKAVAASEELFRTAFEDASVGKALTGVDLAYLRVNRALCRMLGYSAEELLRKNSLDLTHPDDRAASEEAVRRTLAGETSTVQLSKRYVKKDGGVVWADVGVSLVRAPDGSPRYFVTDVQDVTARDRAAE